MSARARPTGRPVAQSAVTVLVPVVPGQEVAIVEALCDLNQDPAAAIGHMGGVHYARWVVVPAQRDLGAWLAYEANVDGEVGRHIEELADRAGATLDRIYASCPGYPAPAERTAASRAAYLRAAVVPYAAWHVGHPGLSVPLILNDDAVRRALAPMVDAVDRSLPPAAIHALLLARMRSEHPELLIGLVDRRLPDNVQDKAILIGVFLLFVLAEVLFQLVPTFPLGRVGAWLSLAALVAALVGGFVLVLRTLLDADVARRHPERAAGALPARLLRPERDDDEMQQILARESLHLQNALTHLSYVEASRFRSWLLKWVLWLIELLARVHYVHGELGNITTIHFGRWVLIDGGRRVLFFSNYDGTWESYLGEFVDKQSTWLSAVWANTEGFPPTEGLFRPESGAGNEEWFKRWVRDCEVLTPFWYAAYPGLSMRNVLDAATLREGLRDDLPEAELSAWLAKL